MTALHTGIGGGVPFTVLGGFLGAGKTTLVNALLTRPRTPRCAILVNDFGDIAVDAALIESHGGDTIALTNGCVCCTIGNQLERAIGNVLDSPRLPQRIIVEASGVSNPMKIADVARISPELSPAGVVVVTDGAAIQSLLTDRWAGDTVAIQLDAADLIVVSKLEQLSPEEQLQVLAFLSVHWPDKPLLPRADFGWTALANLKPMQRIRPRRQAEHAGHAGFGVRLLQSNQPVDLEKLTAWVTRTSTVYRFKGWLVGQNKTMLFCQNNGRQFIVTPNSQPASIGGEQSIRHQIHAVVIGNDNLPSSEAILALIQA